MGQSATQRNALTIGAPSAGAGVVDVHQHQLAVAEQVAATAADVRIQARRPRKAMPQDQPTDVGPRQAARHRQAHGGRGCLGSNMTSRHVRHHVPGGFTARPASRTCPDLSTHAERAAGIGGHRHRHRAAGPRARPPDADHHPQGRQGRHDTAGTAHGGGDRPGHRPAHGQAGVPGSDGPRPGRHGAGPIVRRIVRRAGTGKAVTLSADSAQRQECRPAKIPDTRENRTGRSVHLHPSARRLNQYARIDLHAPSEGCPTPGRGLYASAV